MGSGRESEAAIPRSVNNRQPSAAAIAPCGCRRHPKASPGGRRRRDRIAAVLGERFERLARASPPGRSRGHRRLPLGLRRCRASPCAAGTMNTSTPACATADAFCRSPPMGPTVPSRSIVPVTAMAPPPVSSPSVSSSISVSVNASPADGPPIEAVSIESSNGSSTAAVSNGKKPTIVRVGSSGDAVSSTSTSSSPCSGRCDLHGHHVARLTCRRARATGRRPSRSPRRRCSGSGRPGRAPHRTGST